MKQITVNENDSGQRLDSFLSKLIKDVPKSLIYKWIRKKRIKVNGKKEDISYRLKAGDEISLYINDELFAERKAELIGEAADLKVIYEDKNILVCDKEKGLKCQPDKEGEKSLVGNVRAYLYEKGEYNPEAENTFKPQLCHRIDKNTSGLVIAAKNAASLRIINEKIKNREIRKFYLLRAEGKFESAEGVIEGYVRKNPETNTVDFRPEPFEGAKKAATRYRVLSSGEIEAELLTGRSHQIRASFSYIGHPLSGDVKYGAKKTKEKTYQQLTAAKIIFDFKTDGGILEYLNGKEIKR